MKILVTGATGFIGGYVIDELLSGNHSVIAASNDPDRAKLQPWYSKVKFVEFENSAANKSGENLFEYFGSPDKAIHLAWENLPNYKELFHIEKNLFTDYFFLKKLIAGGLKDLTVTGTCLEYGMKSGCLSESDLPEPKIPYAVAKHTLHVFLEQLMSSHEFALKWVRLFYIYGKGQSEKSLFAQLEKAVENNDKEFRMSGGEQLRDFLPVEKVASNIVKICLQSEFAGTVNCCSGRPQSVRSFAEEYFEFRKKKIELVLGYYPYPDYEPFAFWGDSTRLNSILNPLI